jgi:ABC-type cobalt transport system substrate-binding protein
MLHSNLNSKKAQGLSLQTIIIAALVIIVLVVMIAIFTGKIGDYRRSLDTCSSSITSSTEGSCPATHPIAIPLKGSKEFCCITIDPKP